MAKKRAFTLAEVLITMCIIGIVAALTIPTLSAHFRETVKKNQYKEAFSTISQAHELVTARLGYVPSCYYTEYRNSNAKCVELNEEGNCKTFVSTDDHPLGEGIGPDSGCTELYEELQNSLEISKICTEAYSQGCTGPSKNGMAHAYNGIDTLASLNLNDDSLTAEEKQEKVNLSVGGCDGLKQNYIDTRNAFVLSNGVIYLPYASSYNYMFNKLFLLDINGQDGPNQWGQDLFAFEVVGDEDNIRVRPSNGCAAYQVEGTGSIPSVKMLDYALGK